MGNMIRSRALQVFLALGLVSLTGWALSEQSSVSQEPGGDPRKDECWVPGYCSQQTSIPAPSRKPDGSADPHGGKLFCNVWRGDVQESGSSLLWQYLVSEEYTGSAVLKSIAFETVSTASLRNSASISIGAGLDSVSAGASSSWETVHSEVYRWKNTRGQYLAAPPSKLNIIIGPAQHYMKDTLFTQNLAKLYSKDPPDSRPYIVQCAV